MPNSETHVHNILIVGPAWVGDMVMAQTLFTRLKQLLPSAQLDVLAPSWSQPLLARMPEVRDAITMPIGHGTLDLKTRYALAKSLRSKHYDQAFVLPNSWKSALIPFLANIPRRTGWRGEWRYGLLNDIRRLDKARYPLMIERFMALATPAEAPLETPYPKPKLISDAQHGAACLKKFNLNNDTPILALCPGAEFGPAKRWPERHYAEVAKHYLEKGWHVWLFGSPKDRPVTDQIVALAGNGPIHNLAGDTSLAEAVDLMAFAHLVLSNDSGLMHIACALQRPTVVVYGSSSPDFTPPLSDQVDIVRLGLDCSPCFERTCPLKHLNCLEQLAPEKVLNAMNALVQ